MTERAAIYAVSTCGIVVRLPRHPTVWQLDGEKTPYGAGHHDNNTPRLPCDAATILNFRR